MPRSIFTGILGLLLLTAPAWASENPFALDGQLVMEPSDFIEHPVSRENYHLKLEALVTQASGGKARLVDFFAGPQGLTGVVVQGPEEGSKRMIGWVPPGGDFLMIGNVFDRTAQDITKVANQSFLPTVGTTSARFPREHSYAMAQEFRGLFQFKIKKPVNTLFVFFEPNCSYCRRLHRNIASLKDEFIAAGLQVKWLPVAFVNEQSRQWAASILTGGLDTWDRKPTEKPSEQTLQEVDNNSQLLLHTTPEIRTPFLLWKAGEVDVLSYAPDREELEGLLQLLTDQPK